MLGIDKNKLYFTINLTVCDFVASITPKRHFSVYFLYNLQQWSYAPYDGHLWYLVSRTVQLRESQSSVITLTRYSKIFRFEHFGWRVFTPKERFFSSWEQDFSRKKQQKNVFSTSLLRTVSNLFAVPISFKFHSLLAEPETAARGISPNTKRNYMRQCNDHSVQLSYFSSPIRFYFWSQPVRLSHFIFPERRRIIFKEGNFLHRFQRVNVKSDYKCD